MANMGPYSEKEIRRFFDISVWLKGISSSIEILAGIAIALVPFSYLTSLLIALAEQELIEDPGDIIATHLLQLGHVFVASSQAFIAFYLISRGVIKLALVIALLREQLWAYPASLFVLGIFIAYQAYEILMHGSVFVIAITVFDFIVMYFIWMEYKILRKHMGKDREAARA